MPSSYAPTLLPPPLRQDLSLRSLETLSARTAALDLSVLVLYDYQHVPAQALRTLAEQLNLLGDAGWDFAGFCTAPEARQRALLKEAVALHRLKGTRYALQRALDLMGIQSRLTEWWQTEPPAQPHTFVVDLLLSASDSGPLSPERADALLRLLRFWKPARSQFRARVAVELARHERMAGVLRPAATLRAEGNSPAPMLNFDDQKSAALDAIDHFHSAVVQKLVSNPTQVEKDTWALKLEISSAITNKAAVSAAGQAFLKSAGFTTEAAKSAWAASVMAKSAAYAHVIGLAEKLRHTARTAVKAAADEASLKAALEAQRAAADAAVAELLKGV